MDKELFAETRGLLQEMLGPRAEFHPHQFEAIEHLVAREQRVLLVQRTGWGKSFVYFIATAALRRRRRGPTLLISPLLSLMRNQIETARKAGVRAYTINCTNREDWDDVEKQLKEDACDLLLVSPERLGNSGFQELKLDERIGMLVIDEAHCVSDWGHDFRPDYRRIVRWADRLKPDVPVLATTATANTRVVDDVRTQLGADPVVIRGPLARESLRLFVMPESEQAQRLAWLAKNVPQIPGHGIIYCLTVRDAEKVAAWLTSKGVAASAYHADLPDEERQRLEQALLANEVKALVATVALGMGFDKPDLGFVIHFQRPGSIVAYYQQIGRAGRRLDDAIVLLMAGPEDREINRYFIDNAFPAAEIMQEVLAKLAGASRRKDELLQLVNVRPKTLDQALKILEVEGAISITGRPQQHSVLRADWTCDQDRIEAVQGRRRQELEQIEVRYWAHRGCLMQFLIQALDDPAAALCGRCQNCTGKALDLKVPAELVAEAQAFLGAQKIAIKPRKRWPAGVGESTVIEKEFCNQVGRALCYYADEGLGKQVQVGKYRDNRFDDRLVKSAARLITESWHPKIAWVTAIPSKRHPTLVPDFAERLAKELQVPFKQVLARVADAPEQKTMENSYMQANNVLGSVELKGELLPGPVLLVDDMIDSGWTFAAAGYVLLSKGVPAVHPFALAMTRAGG
ncbi:MAG: RecQ family ATP-dependent DNA helicase [Elusimicrobiota bacterium]|nr:MAG: RecQ family ATP-dependent DNA helicase [Elusimicrobiota bacterium]